MTNLPAFKDPEHLLSDKLKDIHGIWREIAKDRFAPRRDEITPARIRKLIASTWIMDVVGADEFRFRFAGDRIIQFLGRNYAGTLLSEEKGTAFFDAMRAILTACVTQRKPVAVGPRPSVHKGREYLEIEGVVMPLSEDGHAVSALFGGFETWPLGANAKASD